MTIRGRLFAAFDRFMVRRKRKLTLADMWGNVIVHKYCLIWRETSENSVKARKKGSWPNLYLHHFVWPFEESPDGPAKHNHVGSTLSILLRGHYREWYDGKVLERTPGSINIVRWPKTHKIVWVKPNTWTLFLRWFSHDTSTLIVPDTCENVCQHCSDNYGKCFNEGKVLKYDAYIRQFDLNARPDAKKFPKWEVAGPDFDIHLARRRRAAKRLKIETPIGSQEQLMLSRKTSKLPLIPDAEVKGSEVL
jgi:hypothetical protein